MLSSTDIATFGNWREATDEQVTTVKTNLRTLLSTKNIELPETFGCGPERIPQNTQLDLMGYKLHIENELPERYNVDVYVDGTLSMITKHAPVDTKDISDSCILCKFPMVTSDGVVKFNDNGELCLNEDILKIVNMYQEPNVSHQALCHYTESEFYKGDNFYLVPEFSIPGYIAFISNRYAWGMNVNVALLHAESKTVYTWASHNFDYPEGVALKKQDDKYQIYLSQDDYSSELLYHDGKEMLPTIENMHHPSNWYNLPISKDFDKLKAFIEYANSHPDFTNFNDYVEEANKQFEDLYKDRKYEDAVESGRRFLQIPFVDTRVGFFSDTSDAVRIKYNVACCECLLGHLDKAMEYLKSIESEWTNWSHLRTDIDLDNLGENEEFKALLERHNESIQSFGEEHNEDEYDEYDEDENNVMD